MPKKPCPYCDDKIEIKCPRVLAVEGSDEDNFFPKLFDSMQLAGVQVINVRGKENFRPVFVTLQTTEGFHSLASLGFVRDADNHADGAFESIRDTIKQLHLPVPKGVGEVCEGPPRVGVFILPGSRQMGMLEDLCLETVANQPEMVCVESFVGCVRARFSEQDSAKFKESKARVQAYLAARVPLQNSLGLGAQEGHWNLDDPALDPIKAFLRALFP